MTGYKSIKTLNIGDEIKQVFLIASVSGHETRAGKPYTRLRVRDKSGQIEITIWGLDHNEYPELVQGSYASLEIKIEEYKGARQAVCRSQPMIVAAPNDPSVYESDLGLTPTQSQEFYAKLMAFKNSVEDVYIKTYLDVIFDNPEIQTMFQSAPASVTNRGAYRGGLVEHVYKVMLNAIGIMDAQAAAKDPAPIDRDIVIAGVLTHDLGKMYSYRIDSTGPSMTRSGLLLEHLPLSYSVSIQSFIQAEVVLRRAIPEKIKDHINHCILAHHGQLEYGSPVKPRSLEAQIVHSADMADSTSSNYAEPTRDNLNRVDERGFVEGSYFSNRQIFVGDKTND